MEHGLGRLHVEGLKADEDVGGGHGQQDSGQVCGLVAPGRCSSRPGVKAVMLPGSFSAISSARMSGVEYASCLLEFY